MKSKLETASIIIFLSELIATGLFAYALHQADGSMGVMGYGALYLLTMVILMPTFAFLAVIIVAKKIPTSLWFKLACALHISGFIWWWYQTAF